MKAYSTDLRKRILQRYDQGLGTQVEIAELFGVSRSFVQALIRNRKKRGSIEPKPRGGNRPGPFQKTEGQDALRLLVVRQSDATIEQLVELLRREHDIVTSRSAVDRALKQLGISREKNSFSPANAKQKESKQSGQPSGKKLKG